MHFMHVTSMGQMRLGMCVQRVRPNRDHHKKEVGQRMSHSNATFSNLELS